MHTNSQNSRGTSIKLKVGNWNARNIHATYVGNLAQYRNILKNYQVGRFNSPFR